MRGARGGILGAVALIALVATAPRQTDGDPGEGERALRAELRGPGGTTIGRAVFRATAGGLVAISVVIESATPGFHGFQIHANDNSSNGDGCMGLTFESADAHFTLPGSNHGDHAGDLPNILVTHDGRGSLALTTDRFRLVDLHGRAAVLHAEPDNHGHISTGKDPSAYQPNSPAALALTEATGNAGARVACGVIEDGKRAR